MTTVTKQPAVTADAEPFAALEHALTRLIRRAFLPTAGEAARREAGVNLERATYASLVRVVELEGPRLSDLAHTMGLDISTASRHVKRLVGAGFVTVEVCPDDGRARRYFATRDGLAAVDRVHVARRRHLEALLATWDVADVRQLAQGIDRLLTDLAETERSPAR